MKKKLVFGLSAAVVSGAFWACGSGEVTNFDENLDGLTLALLYDISDADVAGAIADCLADSLGCAVEMRNAGPLPFTSSESNQSSSRTTQSSSSNQRPQSSVTPQSSMIFTPPSSSGPVFASSSSTIVEESSSSVYVGPGAEYGSCSPVKNPINRGEKTAWKMTKNATVDAQVILKADFEWNFAGGEPTKSVKHANTSSDEITYATSGSKTATLVFTPQGGAPVSIECAPLQVNGSPITNCKCAAESATVDVAAGGVAKWTISGCTSADANVTSYTWGGTGGGRRPGENDFQKGRARVTDRANKTDRSAKNMGSRARTRLPRCP